MAWEATAVRPRLRVRNDEGRLVRGAAAGESRALVALYRRYEERAFNVAFRITGDEDAAAHATQEAFLGVLGRLSATREGERGFGTYLFAAACEGAHDAMGGRGAAQPGEAGAQAERHATAADHEESLLLEDWHEEIQAANARLPARQREVLALRELGGLSYGEIGQVMELDGDSVAELIAAARIGLRDELRGTDVGAQPLPFEDCGQALQVMAMRDDAELAEGSDDALWLVEHLAACRECRVCLDAMQDARLSYSAWEPVAAPPGLLGETMSRAAELVAPGGGAGVGSAAAGWDDATQAFSVAPPPNERRRRRRREVLLAGGWGAVLLVGVLAVVAGGVFDGAEGEDRPPEPTLDSPTRPETPAAPAKPARRKQPRKRDKEPEVPNRPQRVLQQPAQRAPVVVVAPRPREPRREAPRPRVRRPRTEQPRDTPPDPPPPRQQAPQQAPAPGRTAPTAPTTPAPQQPPAAGCTNPAGNAVPC